MKDVIDAIRHIRNSIRHELEGLTPEQFNWIPPGFNNNIVWNAGHLVAADQRVLYTRSGVEPPISAAFILKYQKGSKPDTFIGDDEIKEIKRLLSDSIEQFEKDYRDGLFSDYAEWTTSYGNTIATLQEAIAFLPFHEGLHFGQIKAFKKLVLKQDVYR